MNISFGKDIKNLLVLVANGLTVTGLFFCGLPFALSISMYGAALIVTIVILLSLVTVIQAVTLSLQTAHLVLQNAPFVNTIFSLNIQYKTPEFYKIFYFKGKSFI